MPFLSPLIAIVIQNTMKARNGGNWLLQDRERAYKIINFDWSINFPGTRKSKKIPKILYQNGSQTIQQMVIRQGRSQIFGPSRLHHGDCQPSLPSTHCRQISSKEIPKGQSIQIINPSVLL